MLLLITIMLMRRSIAVTCIRMNLVVASTWRSRFKLRSDVFEGDLMPNKAVGLQDVLKC